MAAQLIQAGASGGQGLLTITDGNGQTIYTMPFVFSNNQTLGSPIGAFSPSIGGDNNGLPFAHGLFLAWNILAGSFTQGIIQVNVLYDSIPIGQRVDAGDMRV